MCVFSQEFLIGVCVCICVCSVPYEDRHGLRSDHRLAECLLRNYFSFGACLSVSCVYIFYVCICWGLGRYVYVCVLCVNTLL